jgi:hypothetical protein
MRPAINPFIKRNCLTAKDFVKISFCLSFVFYLKIYINDPILHDPLNQFWGWMGDLLQC